ncbi:unnamed protein product [Rhizophagus irregularis]|nr:unnamed protein product [Rhizophagus irregularis]
MTDELSSFSPCIVCKTRIDSNDACDACHRVKELFIPSGNKVIDDFINYTLDNSTKYGRMMFVPYDNFKNIELIGEGGFSRIYKATWIDSKISWGDVLDYSQQDESEIVALKKLKNSKNITSKELNELKIFFHYSSNRKKSYDKYVNIYYDIGPVTTNNPGAIYKSRYLSDMIKSAASTRSLRSKSITSEDHQRSSNNKRKSRKFEDNNQSENNFDNGESIKKIKLIEDKNNGKERISRRVTRQMARVMQNSESRDEYDQH